MKYDKLIKELQDSSCLDDKFYLVELCNGAAEAIEDLQNTLVIVEIKDE